MEYIVTVVLFSIAGYLIFSGKKMSAKKGQEEKENIEEQWKEIHKKRYK